MAGSSKKNKFWSRQEFKIPKQLKNANLADSVGVIGVPAESGGQAGSGLNLFNLVGDKHGSCSHQLEHQSADGHLREEPVQVGYGKLEGLLSEVELVANLVMVEGNVT